VKITSSVANVIMNIPKPSIVIVCPFLLFGLGWVGGLPGFPTEEGHL